MTPQAMEFAIPMSLEDRLETKKNGTAPRQLASAMRRLLTRTLRLETDSEEEANEAAWRARLASRSSGLFRKVPVVSMAVKVSENQRMDERQRFKIQNFESRYQFALVFISQLNNSWSSWFECFCTFDNFEFVDFAILMFRMFVIFLFWEFVFVIQNGMK